MEGPWEESLDVDDSDLPSLLRPSTLLPCTNRNPNANRSDSHAQILPCRSQGQNHQKDPRSSSDPCSRTSSRIGKVIPGPAGAMQVAMLWENAQSRVGNNRNTHDFVDEDFDGNPWLCALDFLGLESRSRLAHTIESTRNMERVPQIVGIIKSCISNGLGDLIVTLKDPTGTIGASIHHKVLAESMSGRDISVGSVVILQQAVAFSPTRSSRYLNVTLNNVVKIFSRNSGPPPKRSFPAAEVRCAVLEKDMEIGWGMSEMTSVRKDADGVADAAVWHDPCKGKGMVAEKRPEDEARNSHCSSILLGNTSAVKVQFHETCGRSGINKLIPRVLVADWTDEQLHELFAED